MKYWVILQSVIDLILFGIVLSFVWKGGQKNKTANKEKDPPDITPLVQSLNQLLEESAVIARRLADENGKANRLLWEMDKKLLIESERLVTQTEQAKPVEPPVEPVADPYGQVTKLLKSGLNSDEVSKKTGVSQHEIDLIAKLSKANQKEG